jgi:nitrite reductase (NO-forming)
MGVLHSGAEHDRQRKPAAGSAAVRFVLIAGGVLGALVVAFLAAAVLLAQWDGREDSSVPLSRAESSTGQSSANPVDGAALSRNLRPDPLAPALAKPGPDGFVELRLTTKEIKARLADNATYAFWTFNGTVPGPMLRVRVGDKVRLVLTNASDSGQPHSIDLHAVNGPGGGAVHTQTPPGQTTSFEFTALNPGLYVYHCATPDVPTHIANGMYGLILVEPKGGLKPVDRELYVVQGEIYSGATEGDLSLDVARMDDERPTYVVLNGAVGAINGENALRARVGERVRIFFGVGGFLPANFHVIGEIFDRVHPEAASEGLSNVQTTLVPAGGAAWVELTIQQPGTYLLVDHALPRTMHKGGLGALAVE